MAAKGMDLFVAILLIVLGVLFLVGSIGLGPLVDILGIVLIILGILMLVNVLPGGTLFGVLALALGILIYLDKIPGLGFLEGILDLVVGIALIIMGVMKLTGR